MSIDATAVIEEYKTLLADAQYMNVLLKLQLQEANARFIAAQETKADPTADVLPEE